MTYEAILNQLGYIPNEALSIQLGHIEKNTIGYEKIIKHILDLHESLKTDESYIALSNSHHYFKIKLDATSDTSRQEALVKINRFVEKYNISLEAIPGKNTYYIKGFLKESK